MIPAKPGLGRLRPAGIRVKTFGNKFRKERERLRFSIEDCAGATKIGARMLKAIEDERFDELPGGIFNKGFIRAYAKHLGMNPEDAVTEYLACMQQRQLNAQATVEPEPARTGEKKRRPQTASEEEIKEELPHLQIPKAEHVRTRQRDFPIERDNRLPWRIVVVAAVALTLAFILWIRHARHVHAQSAKAADSVILSNSETTVPAIGNIVPNPQAADQGAKKLVPQLVKTGSKSGAVSMQQQIPARPLQEGSAQENNLPSAPAITTSVSNTEPLTLVVRATENSWISIAADGQPVAHETLIAPAHTTVHAAQEITVRTGNAAGLTFLLNGKEISAQGAESEVKTFVFNSAGLVSP